MPCSAVQCNAVHLDLELELAICSCVLAPLPVLVGIHNRQRHSTEHCQAPEVYLHCHIVTAWPDGSCGDEWSRKGIGIPLRSVLTEIVFTDDLAGVPKSVQDLGISDRGTVPVSSPACASIF